MIVDKPWGHYQDLHRDEARRWALKTLLVEPGQRLSLQAHEGRREVWYVLDGDGYNEGDAPAPLRVGSLVVVHRGERHRLVAGDHGLHVLELQVGFCQEDDIHRWEDDHGR